MSRRRNRPDQRNPKDTRSPVLATAPDLPGPEDIKFSGCGWPRPLGEEPPFVAVIPFMNRDSQATHRVSALRTIVARLQEAHVRTILVTQGESPEDFNTGGRLYVCEHYDLGESDFYKSTLINRGIEFALERFSDWEWLWQSDADILFPVPEALKVVEDCPEDVSVIVPWKNWLRLTPSQTAVVSDFPQNSRVFEGASPRNINVGAGAGGIMLQRSMLEEGFRWDDTFVNWGWEDSDAAKRAISWGSNGCKVHRGKTSALHLWHENDRVVQVSNGEYYFNGEIPENSMSGVLLEAKTKFLVVAMGRSGGHLLGRSLDLHPQVHCDNKEPFIHAHPDPPVPRRNVPMRNWTLQGPLFSEKPVVGMRMQYGIDNPSFKFSATEYIQWASEQGFHFIHLVRKNSVEMAISNALARRSNRWVFDKYDDTPIYLPPDEFKFYYNWISERRVEFTPIMANYGAHLVYYEDLCENWDFEMAKVFSSLGVDPTDVEPAIPKQTRKPHREYLSNWPEIEEMAKSLENESQT